MSVVLQLTVAVPVTLVFSDNNIRDFKQAQEFVFNAKTDQNIMLQIHKMCAVTLNDSKVINPIPVIKAFAHEQDESGKVVSSKKLRINRPAARGTKHE